MALPEFKGDPEVPFQGDPLYPKAWRGCGEDTQSSTSCHSRSSTDHDLMASPPEAVFGVSPEGSASFAFWMGPDWGELWQF